MAQEKVTIRTQPVSVDEGEARQRIRKPPQTGTRVKHALAGVSVDSLFLSYKPFYTFETTLTKEGRFVRESSKEGRIIVDAVTGIARARPEEYGSVERVSVPQSSIVARDLDEKEALKAAQKFQVKLEHRENREAELSESPDIAYKPVWIADIGSKNKCVVDAINGEVFSDVSLCQALPFVS